MGQPAYVVMAARPVSRRNALRIAGLTLASVCTTAPSQPAYALKPGKPSKEKLLNSLRDERTPEEIEADKERVAEERKQRLERQRELQAAADRRKAGIEEDDSKSTEIESNLRGQYYYPTARKRYLPRVKVAWESIPSAEEAVRNGEWNVLNEMVSGSLGDAVLPMKLYASSLGGGGLNVSAKFIAQMTAQVDVYDGAIKKLGKTPKKKETSKALDNLASMKEAIQKYRQAGRLEAEDFGIGEIPTAARMGSGFGNNNASLYNKNKGVQSKSSVATDEL